MSDYYKGAKNNYDTGWNDNILTAINRADDSAPYSKEVTIPDRLYNVKNQGDWVNIYQVGVNCTFKSGEYANYAEKLVFEKYIEDIGAYAFQNYKNVKVIELSERLKTIGDYAFKNNTSLTSIVIPANIETIGKEAFAGCTSLTSVYILNPNSVSIAADAFPAGVNIYVAGEACKASVTGAGYANVTVIDSATVTTKLAGRANRTELDAIEAARETTVDSGTYYHVTNTNWKALYKGIEIRSFALNNRDAGVLDIPKQVPYTNDKGETSTEDVALLYINAMCLTAERSRIYEIRLPNKGLHMQMGVFENMTNLKRVIMPDLLYNLSQFEFYNCVNLSEILVYGKEDQGNLLPSNLRGLGERMFENCTSLTNIKVPENIRLPEKLDCYWMLQNSAITSIDVPVAVSAIRDSMLENAPNLTRVNFYNKNAKFVKMSSGNILGENSDCTPFDRTKVTLGVIKGSWMEEYAIKNSYAFVYINDPLADYENNPDSNVNNFTVTASGTGYAITDYLGIGGKLIIPSSGNTATETMVPVYSIANGAFSTILNRLYSVEISEGIVQISESAFANATSLKSVKFPNTLKTIGKEAFKNAGIQGVVTIPKNVTQVGNSAFTGCNGITAVYVLNANTSISSGAFPETAVIYGIKDSTAQAYAEKNNMQFVAIDAPSAETASDIADNGNYKFTIDANGVITGYERIDNSKAYSLRVTIPATVNGVKVTSIGSNIFENGAELSSVYALTISEGITSIGDYAFSNTPKLTHISLPKSLTTIGRSAFENCAISGELEFSENVKDIGMMAFKGNNQLTKATILNKTCLIKASAFPRGLKTFTLCGYYNSTAMSYAERSNTTFVSLDGTPDTGDGDGTDETPKTDEPNYEEPTLDPVEDPNDNQGGGTITVIQNSDLTTVIIVAVAMLMFMLLIGGGLILFIIIAGKKHAEQ